MTLGPLQNNGGPTLTHAPQTGRPAIGKGNPATPGSGGNACAANDQRGYARPVDGDTNGSALCDVGAYEVGATGGAIVYVYDPLYRLTSANYGDGTTFNYTYDAVGNRLTQTTITNTTVYTYDAANRLTNVGGIAYTWDANGNLLNDGVYTYTYDSANRLTSALQGTNTYTFGYNGVGDRMRQVANGITTTYTLDLNAGLTQVLADGTNTYLHGVGNGRIAQYAGTTPAYFLGDALGSVRQLANASGAVTLARSYQPYGSVMSSAGTGTTAYAFGGEWQDGTNLLHLRARYLSVQTGRFLTRDVWARSYTRPLSFNAWLYAYADPVNLTDPTGHKPLSLGYMEGISYAGGLGHGDISGGEIVYDYATMTRARFKYQGTVGGLIAGAGFAAYVGGIVGFRYEPGEVRSKQILNDYSGEFDGFYVGGSVTIYKPVVGVTVGVGYFQSQDGSIKGGFQYLSAGIGFLPGEIVAFKTFYDVDPVA